MPPDPPPTEAARFAVSGQVVDAAGEPVVDVFVTVSTEFCIPDRTAADGSFTVGDVAPGPKRLITYGETASNGLFASVSVAFEAETAHQFDAPIETPELVELHPIDPAQGIALTTSDGLSIDIAAGALEIAPFAPLELQVARVPVDRTPFGRSDLLDVFVLHPILSFIEPPAAVTFPAGPLAPGTRVRFEALNYDTGTLEVVATGFVDDDGRPTTDPGQGVPELTWIALTMEP